MSKKESLYKILGTTANIGNDRIKEKYIEALRKHSPETDPEGFERVRHAYETLRDPEKRMQYDLERNHGANMDELLADAQDAFRLGDNIKVKKLLEKASKFSTEDPTFLTGMMMLAIAEKDLDKMDEYFEQVINTVSSSKDLAPLYSMKAAALLEHEYYEKALEALEKWKAINVNTEEKKIIEAMISNIYIHLGQGEEAWNSINTAILAIENEIFDDIYIFISWSNMMIELEKWEAKSKVQSRFRKFIKNLTDEDEKDRAYDMIDDIIEELLEAGEFRAAEFYIDLQLLLDNTDSELKQKRVEIKELARVQKDIDRLQGDEEAFPLIYIHALEWFYDGIMVTEDFQAALPSYMMSELKQEKEAYAAGILRLRKKYASLYKHFKDEWDHLFVELTEGFNREMKRDLRRMR